MAEDKVRSRIIHTNENASCLEHLQKTSPPIKRIKNWSALPSEKHIYGANNQPNRTHRDGGNVRSP